MKYITRIVISFLFLLLISCSSLRVSPEQTDTSVLKTGGKYIFVISDHERVAGKLQSIDTENYYVNSMGGESMVLAKNNVREVREHQTGKTLLLAGGITLAAVGTAVLITAAILDAAFR